MCCFCTWKLRYPRYLLIMWYLLMRWWVSKFFRRPCQSSSESSKTNIILDLTTELRGDRAILIANLWSRQDRETKCSFYRWKNVRQEQLEWFDSSLGWGQGTIQVYLWGFFKPTSTSRISPSLVTGLPASDSAGILIKHAESDLSLQT